MVSPFDSFLDSERTIRPGNLAVQVAIEKRLIRLIRKVTVPRQNLQKHWVQRLTMEPSVSPGCTHMGG